MYFPSLFLPCFLVKRKGVSVFLVDRLVSHKWVCKSCTRLRSNLGFVWLIKDKANYKCGKMGHMKSTTILICHLVLSSSSPTRPVVVPLQHLDGWWSHKLPGPFYTSGGGRGHMKCQDIYTIGCISCKLSDLPCLLE